MVKEQQIISAIKNLNLSQDEKKRMFKFVDVIDIKRKRKIMSLQSLVKLIRQSNCEVLRFVIGPDWNRILFVDLNLEFKE
jgi:hypothetical protein